MSYARAVAVWPSGKKCSVTGSGDEIIKVWDLSRRREIGGLVQHEGAARIPHDSQTDIDICDEHAGSTTHLSFLSRSHLPSVSEDGLFHARSIALLERTQGEGELNHCAPFREGGIQWRQGRNTSNVESNAKEGFYLYKDTSQPLIMRQKESQTPQHL